MFFLKKELKIKNLKNFNYYISLQSLLKPNAYIVTQGPTEETVFNFWRMIWQENVSAIIMLTKVFDFTKVCNNFKLNDIIIILCDYREQTVYGFWVWINYALFNHEIFLSFKGIS